MKGMNHIEITNANMEPVFFAYPAQAEMDWIIEDIVKNQEPNYDFICGRRWFWTSFLGNWRCFIN